MIERLRTGDMAVLAGDTPCTPMHNMTLDVFDPAETGLDHETLLAHIEDRISFVPRYRQRLRTVPAGLAHPLWVDDAEFDLTYHVRRSALPRPGTREQLRDLAARIMSRPLDPARPLWEVYLVEGLADGRVALLAKSHQVLVDGISTVDLGQVLLDLDQEPGHRVLEEWEPTAEPSPARLLTDAVVETVRDPFWMMNLGWSMTSRTAKLAGSLLDRRQRASSPFNGEACEQRRVVLVSTALKDYRKVRRTHGGTINDVILATLTGAIRAWLMTRAEPVPSTRRISALVPMSVLDEEMEPTQLGSQVIGHRLDLPVGETSPIVRLHQVSYAFKAHSETGRAVAADRIAGVAGFAPNTFHALGARVAFEEAEGTNLVITNVPGPQFPMFLAGARMTETYPLPPLQDGFTAAIGVTSYDGTVFYGITADRDALPDIDVLGQCIHEALDELVDTTSEDRRIAPRGRRR